MERHGFLAFMVRRNLARADAWCHCAAALGNPELFEPLAAPPENPLAWSPWYFVFRYFLRAEGIAL
jgi:hypothetical protein